MSDATIETAADLMEVLRRITFAPSCIGLEKAELRFDVTEAIRPSRGFTGSAPEEPRGWQATEPLGWFVRLTFERPDTETGVVGRGSGRWELVEIGASESGVVKTCWLLLELLVRHELMESFMVDGIRIFSPHLSLDDLQAPGRSKG